MSIIRPLLTIDYGYMLNIHLTWTHWRYWLVISDVSGISAIDAFGTELSKFILHFIFLFLNHLFSNDFNSFQLSLRVLLPDHATTRLCLFFGELQGQTIL
jgi:hypothetical protein